MKQISTRWLHLLCPVLLWLCWAWLVHAGVEPAGIRPCTPPWRAQKSAIQLNPVGGLCSLLSSPATVCISSVISETPKF